MAELIIALDVPDRRRALELVDRLGDAHDYYKVGLELFTGWGPEAVTELRARGKKVFLDLKLHDIPNTVAGAVRSAGGLGADLITVHAAGGSRMMEAAARAALDSGGVRVVAVTVLTSLDAGELESVWGRRALDPAAEALRLARQAREAGVAGVVASAHEAPVLRSALGPKALLVTPGIRLEGDDLHDQMRVATPAWAVRAGADHLVVGRAVTATSDPPAALRRIRAEMEAA
jgi:orotidine-5'-phosphate decarboxylase